MGLFLGLQFNFINQPVHFIGGREREVSGWERKEEENGGRVMCVERQERDLEGQGNEWKYAAVGA